MPATERREFRRFRGEARVRVERLAGADVHGTLANVSPKGFCLSLPEPLAIAESVLVRLITSDGSQLTLPASVVHVTPSQDVNFLVGCQLLDWISPDRLDALRAFEGQPLA